MKNRTLDPPGDLTEEQWRRIEAALKGSRYMQPYEVLRRLANAPTPAHAVLPKDIDNQGEGSVSQRLLLKGADFRLARIGPRCESGIERRNRLLAFVEWDEEKRRLFAIRKGGDNDTSDAHFKVMVPKGMTSEIPHIKLGEDEKPTIQDLMDLANTIWPGAKPNEVEVSIPSDSKTLRLTHTKL